MSSEVFDNTRLKCGLCPCEEEEKKNTIVGVENLCILVLNTMIMMIIRKQDDY